MPRSGGGICNVFVRSDAPWELLDAPCTYWTRQWAVVSPHVEPVAFNPKSDDAIVVEVVQTIRGLDGEALQARTHGLKDKAVRHIFHMEGDKVARFDNQDTE